ncbi:MAG: FAD-dependent oxidoreductase, partial [Abditibacteriota bacterium]|nr:FAD-dependent oxidoreductase [Abditibacteriota bacterium]
MKNFDIIVIGGGVAGCGAAISAARQGAKVLLAERHGFLGGCS